MIRRFVLSTALLVLTAQPPLSVQAQTPGTPDVPTLETSGQGEVRVAPDRATVMLAVQTEATTAATAAASNARRLRAVLDTLRAVGLTSEQLSTLNYTVYPRYAPNTSTPHVVGYTVTNSVRAEVESIANVGKVIDAALGGGANEVSSLSFYSSTEAEARRRAIALAVQQARADAEALATAAGGKLGPLVNLSTGPATSPIYPMARMSMAAAAAPTPIEPGQQTISATVVARWQFSPRD